jgi:CDGSH-type Zn-finger protein
MRGVESHPTGHTDEMKITATENGPLKIEDASELELYDHDGSEIDLAGRAAVFLCRCGGSTNKPFCDGTHSKVGFEGARAAVEAS